MLLSWVCRRKVTALVRPTRFCSQCGSVSDHARQMRQIALRPRSNIGDLTNASRVALNAEPTRHRRTHGVVVMRVGLQVTVFERESWQSLSRIHQLAHRLASKVPLAMCVLAMCVLTLCALTLCALAMCVLAPAVSSFVRELQRGNRSASPKHHALKQRV